MRPERNIEKEFGVPFPGEILPPEQWSRTALKRMPPPGPLDWEALFGRSAPRILEIGCGNGRYLIGSAGARKDHDHLGIDILPVVIRYATRRGNQRGLSNLRFAVIGGREFLEQYAAPNSLHEIHLYHPQPYYRPEEVGRRLVTPAFLARVHQSLVPGGRFFLQTDHPGYWKYMAQTVPCFFDFAARTEPWPDTPKGRTRREIMARRKGLPVFRGEGTAKADLDIATAQSLAESLPLPTFDADRRLQDLDREE